MKKNFLFKGVSILGAILLLANVVLPGINAYAHSDDTWTWDYIYDETSWYDSATNGALKVYYENKPSEDLWCTSTGATWNDRVYTAIICDDANCSDQTPATLTTVWGDPYQTVSISGTSESYKLALNAEVGDTIYTLYNVALPTTCTIPEEAPEDAETVTATLNGWLDAGECVYGFKLDAVNNSCQTEAENKPTDSYIPNFVKNDTEGWWPDNNNKCLYQAPAVPPQPTPSGKYVKLISFSYPGCAPSYQGRIANGAVSPWVAVTFKQAFAGTIKFNYDGADVYPRGETSKNWGPEGKVRGVASLPGEFPGITSFDKNKFDAFLVEPIAKIGETNYATIAGAIYAANEGDTVEIIKAGEYTFPDTIPNNITIKGIVDGVKFKKKESGAYTANLANVPNGATFENITLDLDVTPYHNGFGTTDMPSALHNTTPIIMKNCVINGTLYTRGNMEFDGCTFNVPDTPTTAGTKLWQVYMRQGNLTFKNCIFNGYDRNIHAVANGASNPTKDTQWNIKIENCIFSKRKTSDKSAVIVKEANGESNNGYVLNYKVEITNPSISGNADYYQDTNLGNKYYMMDALIAGGDTDGSYLQKADPEKDYVGSGTLEGGNVVVILNGTTVYSTPKRNQNWTVTFDGTNETQVADGSKAAKPTDPSKSCYSFVEWQLNSVAYDFNSVVTGNLALTSKWNYTCSSSSGGGSGGGSTPKSTVTDDKTTTTDENKTEENKDETTQGEEDQTPEQGEESIPLASQEELQNPEAQDWYDKSGDQQEVLEDGLTREMHNAYEFAVRAGITTMKSAAEANMYGPLNRIAMAKMLVNYAINVLGMKPDTTRQVPDFGDISEQLNKDYGDAVTLAYQLGIMGIGITEFRPFDEVPRGEFGTALSRLLFGTADGEGTYYETHLAKLKAEGIITNDDPDLEEARGYVMIMLMRSVNKAK